MPAEPGYSRYELVDIDLTPEVEALALARSAALASSAPLETGLAPGPIVAEAVGLQLLSGETRQEPPSPDAGEEVGAERAALELPEAPAEPASETAAADLDTAFRNLREDRIGASPAVAAAQDIARAEAFRAAGLVEEATRLLESASEEPGVRFLAQTTLGELHRERGDLDQAIGCFERALESTSDPGATWQARYALAEALEAAGESSRALVVLLELLAEADEYKDARAWAERLAQAQGGG